MDITLSIKHDISQVPVVGRLVRQLCEIAVIEEHLSVSRLELAVVELLNNIIRYSGLSSTAKLIDVQCLFKGETFRVTVSESGPSLPASVARAYTNKLVDMPSIDTVLDELPESGWGIQLIKSACDEIHYQRVGEKNRYQLVFEVQLEPVC